LPEIDLEAVVSKGTYIRTLAVQIGERLELPAHLAKLRRTAVGSHRIEGARSFAELRGEPSELLPIERAVEHLALVAVGERSREDVSHGRRLAPAVVEEGAAGPIP